MPEANYEEGKAPAVKKWDAWPIFSMKWVCFILGCYCITREGGEDQAHIHMHKGIRSVMVSF